MRGAHLIQHYAHTQSTVALSSKEAELSGICKGASKAIGLRSLCRDPGIPLDLAVLTDATAAIGLCRRRWRGKIKHLAVADLWIHHRVKATEFALCKVAGQENPADMLTKHVPYPTMIKHLQRLGLFYEPGRAQSAPTLTH